METSTYRELERINDRLRIIRHDDKESLKKERKQSRFYCGICPKKTFMRIGNRFQEYYALEDFNPLRTSVLIYVESFVIF